MSIVEREEVQEVQKVTEPVVIKIKQNADQDFLDWMIVEVEMGRWTTGAFMGPNGSHCTLGMIRYKGKEEAALVDALVETTRGTNVIGTGAVVRYNDRLRKPESVIAWYRRAKLLL